LELPIDRHARGTVLRDAFSGIAPPPREDLVGTIVVRRVSAEGLSEREANEYAQRLKSLGYLSGSEPTKLTPTGGDRPAPTEVAWNNLGVYLRENTKEFPEAEAAFRKAIALTPRYSTPLFNLAVLYRMRGMDEKAIDWLFRSFAAGHAHAEDTILN